MSGDWRADRCNEPGPWEARCTDYPGHRWSHSDSQKDTSWQDDWREDTPPSGGGTWVDEEDPALDPEGIALVQAIHDRKVDDQ